MTEEQNVYKFRIDVKEDDINKCREVLSVILYLAGYCIPNLPTPIPSHGAKYTNYGISLPQPCPPPSNLSATAWEKKQIKSSFQESDHALPCPTL